MRRKKLRAQRKGFNDKNELEEGESLWSLLELVLTIITQIFCNFSFLLDFPENQLSAIFPTS